MTEPYDDTDLGARLAALGHDLDQTDLPGPVAARRRGRARTRNQLGGLSLGVVAVAAATAVAIGGPSARSEPEPVQPGPGLLGASLLESEDLAAIDDLTSTPVPAEDWVAEDTGGNPPLACVPSAPEPGAGRAFTVEGPTGTTAYSGVSTGESAYDDLRQSIWDCRGGADEEVTPDAGFLEASDLQGLGDRGFLASYTAGLSDDGAVLTVTVGVVEHEGVTAVAALADGRQDAPGQADARLLEAAAGRLCAAQDTTCVGDVQREPAEFGDSPDPTTLVRAEDLPDDIDWSTSAVATPEVCVPIEPATDRPAVTHLNDADPAGYVTAAVSSSITDVEQAQLDLLGCAESTDGVDLVEVTDLGGLGDRSWLAWYWAGEVEQDSRTLVLLTVVEVDDEVTVTAQVGPAMDANGPAPTELTGAAASRLCAASDEAGTACLSDLVRSPVFPEPAEPTAGFPSPAQVGAVLRLPAVETVSDEREGDEVADVCLPVLDDAVDRRSVDYGTSADPTSPEVTLHRLAFPDAEAAAAYVDGVPADDPDCAPWSDPTVVDTAEVVLDPDSADGPARAWRQTDPDVGIAFVRGISRAGSDVVVATRVESESTAERPTAEEFATFADDVVRENFG